jgi:hypothetical protein
MDTLLTERQILLRKEIGSFSQTTDRRRTSEVRTDDLRSAFWGPERTILDRVLALEELSRRDPGQARAMAGNDFDHPVHGSVYRTAALLGKTDGRLNDRLKDFEAAGAAAATRTSALRESAREITDLITALETARFLAFRAACLADRAAAGADGEASKCEALAVEIAERAALAGRAGRLREGERT